MPPIIDKPSQLVVAIVEAIRRAKPGITVASRKNFTESVEQPWVLIAIERDATASRARDGRIAHDLSISLQVVMPPESADPQLAACDLSSALKDLVTDNRWDLSGDQCEVPVNLDAVPSAFVSGTRAFPAWTLSFTQTLYFGTPLLDDPLGAPKYARTWEVSDIDDPDQYTELEG